MKTKDSDRAIDRILPRAWQDGGYTITPLVRAAIDLGIETEIAVAVAAEREAIIGVLEKHYEACNTCCPDCARHCDAVARAIQLVEARGQL